MLGDVGWSERPQVLAQSVHLRNIYIKLGGLIRDPGRTNLVGQPPQGITRTGTWALLDNHSHSSPTIFYEFWNILEQPHFSRARTSQVTSTPVPGVQGAQRSGQIKLSGANGPLFVGEARGLYRELFVHINVSKTIIKHNIT